MKFNHVALAGLMFVSAGTTPIVHQAHAEESAYQGFFSTTEGSWRGYGAVSEIQPNGTSTDGSWTVRRYRADLDVTVDTRGRDEKVWNFEQELRFEDSTFRFGTIEFSLRDGDLFISSHSPIDPAWVDVSSENELAWRSRRFDPITRRVWDLQHFMELSEDGRKLRGENRVWSNGKLVTIETYELKKRH